MCASRVLTRLPSLALKCRKDLRFYCSQKFIVKSQYPLLNIPNMTLDEFMWQNLEKWPDKTALVCGETGRSLTYYQIKKSSERLAQALRTKMGLNVGDMVATVMPNVPDYCVALLGCIKAGLVVTTINPIYTRDEISKQLTDSGAKMVFTLPEMWKIVNEAKAIIKRNIPIVIANRQVGQSLPQAAINFEELCNYDGPTTNFERRNSQDLVLLPYSSGTTGLPKGVCLSQGNLVANLCQMQFNEVRLNQETTKYFQDVIPVILPMYHLYALMIIFMNMFSMGCQLVMMPRYTPEKFLKLLSNYKATVLHAVPPIIHFMSFNEEAKKTHLERVQHLLSAAAPLVADDTRRFLIKYDHGIKILQGYGLTETSPLTHIQSINRPVVNGSSGWLIPNTECMIMSLEEHGKIMGPLQTGELYIRGPQIMQGYHNNPEATSDTIDAEGWLHTGDIGYVDEDEQFFITDRLKELIKVKGFQVAPAELEGVLREHPEILDAAVIGVKHPQGEQPKAFIVQKPTSRIKSAEIQEYVNTKVAKYKRLTGGVEFIDAIPRNPSGKILRKNLKNL